MSSETFSIELLVAEVVSFDTSVATELFTGVVVPAGLSLLFAQAPRVIRKVDTNNADTVLFKKLISCPSIFF